MNSHIEKKMNSFNILKTRAIIMFKHFNSRRWIRRILVRRGGGVGDLLMLTPALRGLRGKYPEAEIIVATDYPELFELNPVVTEVHALGNGIDFKAKFDLKFDPKYETSYPLREHITDILCRAVGVGPQGRTIDLFCSLEDHHSVMTLLRGISKRFIVIQPWVGPWAKSKNWNYDSWTRVVSLLGEELGFAVIQLGGKDDLLISGAVDFRGTTSLRQSALVIQRAALFLGCNSSGEQLAQAVLTPSVILYGTTHPVGSSYAKDIALYGGKTNTPCYDRGECSHGPSTEKITVEIVYEAVKGQLAKSFGQESFLK